MNNFNWWVVYGLHGCILNCAVRSRVDLITETERDPLCQHPVRLFIHRAAPPTDVRSYPSANQCRGLAGL